MTQHRRVFETLNGIRGVAALCVVVFHTYTHFWPQQANSGYLAVDLFFVLSGFVLAEAYGGRLADGDLAGGRFAVLRLIRFYPLYLAGLLLGLGQLAAQHATASANALPVAVLPAAIAFALLFLPAIGSAFSSIAPLNGPSWSLIYELWVNLAWAGVARRVGIAFYWAVLLLAGSAFLWFVIANGNANIGTNWAAIPAGLARTLYSFTAGLLIYRMRNVLPALESRWSLLILLAVAGLLFVDPPADLRLAYDLVVALAVSPLLIAIGARFEPPPSWRPLFVFLGVVSFPVYVIHMPLIAAWVYGVRVTGIAPAAGGLAFLVTVVLLAWLADKVDILVRRRLVRALGGRAVTVRHAGIDPRAD